MTQTPTQTKTVTPVKKPSPVYDAKRLLEFLKESEGSVRDKKGMHIPYLDQAGLPTIGYGTRYYTDGTEVTMDDAPIDEATATGHLQTYMTEVGDSLMSMPGFKELNPNQKAALISFGYNFGANFYKDKANFGIISGAVEDNDIKAIQDAFGLYVNVTDDTNEKGYSKSQGLINRRNKELDLFNEPIKVKKPKPKSMYDKYVNKEEEDDTVSGE